MTAVDDDVREFVAARWPDLEAVAHVVVLDPVLARRLTTDTLLGLARGWQDALEDGRPGERARADLLRSALAGAGRSASGPVRPTDRGRPAGGAAPTGPTVRPDVPSAVPWDDAPRAEDAVVAALATALRGATPLERALVAALHVWDAGPDEVTQLLDRPPAPVLEAAARVGDLLAAAHDEARGSAGLDPARWALEHDTAEALTLLLSGHDEPPDPASLVAGARTRLRRRSLVVGGTAAAGLAAGAWAVGSSLSGAPAGHADVPVPPAGSPTWASTRSWVARGALRQDPAVTAMVLARGSGARLLWADDVADRRVVIARGDLSRQGSTTLRVWSGPRGAVAGALEEVPLRVPEIEDSEDVVALALPTGSGGGLLVLLSRPRVLRCEYSPLVSYTRTGGVRRAWREAGLDDGVATVALPLPPGPALRVRLGGYDGPPAGPQRVTLGTVRETEDDLAESVLAAASPFVAAASGQPPASLESAVVLEADVPGDVLAPWVVVARPGLGRVAVVHTRTPDGAVLRSVRVRDDGRATVSSADLETARPIGADDVLRPFATRLPPVRTAAGRFLVLAPGAARAQLLALTATSYPVSEVIPLREGVGILEVVNSRQAAVYRLVLWDAEGATTESVRQLFGRRDPNDMWPRFG